jgi:hypothetical protein
MLPDTLASFTEVSDIVVGLTIRTGWAGGGGGVYVEVDTDGVGCGCGAFVVGFAAGGDETGGRGVGCAFPAGVAAGGAGEVGGGTGECVAVSFTLDLADRPGLALCAWVGAVPLTGLDAPTTSAGLLSPVAASWLECELPDNAKTSTATTAAAPTAAAAAAVIRDTRRGLGTATGFGKPSWPNCPDRCVTEVRWARPAGVSSVQTFMIRPCRLSGSCRSGTGVTGSGGGVPPAAMTLRKHSLRATACSHWPSRAGSRSPSSLVRATTNVSSTTSAASACGKMLRQ